MELVYVIFTLASQSNFFKFVYLVTSFEVNFIYVS